MRCLGCGNNLPAVGALLTYFCSACCDADPERAWCGGHPFIPDDARDLRRLADELTCEGRYYLAERLRWMARAIDAIQVRHAARCSCRTQREANR